MDAYEKKKITALLSNISRLAHDPDINDFAKGSGALADTMLKLLTFRRGSHGYAAARASLVTQSASASEILEGKRS